VNGINGVDRQPCVGDRRDQGVAVASDLEGIRSDPLQDPVSGRSQPADDSINLGPEIVEWGIGGAKRRCHNRHENDCGWHGRQKPFHLD
jgi:hypothetical protein